MHDHSAEELRLPFATPEELRAAIVEAAADKARVAEKASAIREVVYRLDQGTLRVAERNPPGSAERWTVHGWIQQAINLFFGIAQSEPYAAGDLRFFDKIPPKQQLGEFRVVPPGVVRYGAYVEKGA